jgi:hypothetical protein
LQEGRVSWWYRQNLFLFASSDAISNSPALRAEQDIAAGADVELVHVSILYRTPRLRELIKQLLPTAQRALRHRLNSALSRILTADARERNRSAEDVIPSQHG